MVDRLGTCGLWSYQVFLKRNQYNDPDPIKLWPDPAILGFITPLFHLNKRVSDPDPFVIEGGLLIRIRPNCRTRNIEFHNTSSH